MGNKRKNTTKESERMIETKHERLISGRKRVVFQNKVMMFGYSLKLSAEQVTPVHARIVAQCQTNFVRCYLSESTA